MRPFRMFAPVVAVSCVVACGPEGAGISPAPLPGGGLAPEGGAQDAGRDVHASGDATADSADSSHPSSSRGDPTKFPTVCVEGCTEACAKVVQTCGGDKSTFPIPYEDCLQRCGLAQKGPMWDDVSGSFRCCASQPSCDNALTCGGWLAHPSPIEACDKLCGCFFGTAGLQASGGVTPPPGYQFATDTLVFRGPPPAELDVTHGARKLFSGAYSAVQFTAPWSQTTASKARSLALPTFRGTDGRLAAAVGGVVIKLSSAAPLPGLRAELHKAGMPGAVRLSYGDHLYYVDSRDPWLAVRALPKLNQLQGVVAELDMVRHYVTNHVPNDPLFANQWHLLNTGKSGSIPAVDGRVSEAWDVTKGDPKVVIAINDDGVDVHHPDLSPNSLPPMNFPTGWEQHIGTASGIGQHGTSVAGVAAAVGDNNLGGTGVCPKCKILPHLLGPSTAGAFDVTDKEVADGFTAMVDAGAWIISNSWGPGTGDPRFEIASFPVSGTATVLAASFAYAETKGRSGKGTVILFAAGNENEPVGAYAVYKTNLGVGAVDDQGVKSFYSNWGAKLAISAPSNGGLQGITTTAATPQNSAPQFTSQFGGTSSACPFAAGVAGLILSANPNLTAAEVREVIKKSASRIDPVWGKWNSSNASPYYGAGMVNAWRAVKMAKGECTDPTQCPAPSDACSSGCDGSSCGECRSDANCATGYSCQALASLGKMVCVAASSGGSCPSGTTLLGSFCVPDRKACGMCVAQESCDGRDEDCNGKIDDNISCKDVPTCMQDGQGCDPTKQVCAATYCATKCETDADCGDGVSCNPVKDRYGNFDNTILGCGSDGIGTCKVGCQILASSLDDAALKDFVDCMQNGTADCSVVQTCVTLLPVIMSGP